MAQVYDPIPKQAEEVGTHVVDAAIKVHEFLGPGLLESAYRCCLARELEKRGVSVQTEVALPLIYEEMKLEVGYRMDVVASGCVVIEAKSLDAIHPIHEAQLLTYLRLSGCRLGFLLNFNVLRMKEGIRRFVV